MEKTSEIIDHLASSLGRRDELPNQQLAAEVVKADDREAVEVLVGLLAHRKKDIRNDSIKTLYEIGEQKPALIAPFLDRFLSLLTHPDNRLQWGAMTAISHIARVMPEEVYEQLPSILEAADEGSVITHDQAVNILITLADSREFSTSALKLLKVQLLKSPVNQLPMYAEKALPVIEAAYKNEFADALRSRLQEIEKESKKKRVEKVIKKLAG